MAETLPSSFGKLARSAGVGAVFGVPDSLMKHAINALDLEFSPHHFTIAPNEGAAVGMAMGYYLSTGKIPLVFLQNSGLGNALNPLVSLAHAAIYSIPCVLLIGWRAEVFESGEQKEDEPQHKVQGRATIGQLELIDIRYQLLEGGGDAFRTLAVAVQEAKNRLEPVAILVRSGAIQKSQAQQLNQRAKYPTREELVGIIAEATQSTGPHSGTPVVATTGMASRELYEARQSLRSPNTGQDFLTVGGMGHAISIAATIAKEISPQRVICLDGDGAALMHMGSLLYSAKQKNLIHIILDNGVHDSVGGQPTGFRTIALDSIASGFGYASYIKVETKEQLSKVLDTMGKSGGSVLIHALCEPGHRNDLGRPKAAPQQGKDQFMQFLSSTRGDDKPSKGNANGF